MCVRSRKLGRAEPLQQLFPGCSVLLGTGGSGTRSPVAELVVSSSHTRRNTSGLFACCF